MKELYSISFAYFVPKIPISFFKSHLRNSVPVAARDCSQIFASHPTTEDGMTWNHVRSCSTLRYSASSTTSTCAISGVQGIQPLSWGSLFNSDCTIADISTFINALSKQSQAVHFIALGTKLTYLSCPLLYSTGIVWSRFDGCSLKVLPLKNYGCAIACMMLALMCSCQCTTHWVAH